MQPGAQLAMATTTSGNGKANIERLCRICLRQVGEEQQFHFIYDETPMEQGANLVEILDACTSYMCERLEDAPAKMPHHICEECLKAACQAYRFKREAEKSYCSLMSLLGLEPAIKHNEVSTQTDQVALLPCEMCHDKFLNSLELRLHRNREHSGQKGSPAEEFKCKFCPQQFQKLRQLRSHLSRIHDQVDRVQCNLCDRAFSRRDHLQRHMKNMHKSQKSEEEEQPIDPDGPDELESVEVLLDDVAVGEEEGELGNDQCNTNPISSNEESDDDNDEAKKSLWLNIKPEPCLEAEPEAEQVNVKATKRRRKKAEQAEAFETTEAEVKAEPLAHVESVLHIKQESQMGPSEEENAIVQIPTKTLPSDEDEEEIDDDDETYEFIDEESPLDDDDDDDDDDGGGGGTDDENDNNDGQSKPKVEIVREYLQKSKKPKRRRRRNRDESEPNPENRCDVCQRTFSRHCHLLRHKLSHLEKKPHSCPHCPKAFARSDHLKAHVQSLHSSKEHKCELCQAAFARSEALERHKLSRHNGVGVPEGSELKHQLEHTCEYCSKRFSSKTYLRKHTLLHTDFLYACKSCEETFKERQQLREHEKTHTGQRNFLCCICGDSFARNDYLRVHMRRHNGEKPYKCRYCVKAFPRATDLKVHERYHTGTKPNLCNTCGKSFHRAYNLTIHMRTHTGERPYKCDQCPKSFTQSNDLKAHIRRHTGERYKCPHCDAYFLQLYNMRNHCLSAHNKHIETKTGRLQRTGLLDEGNQSHFTTVVMPPGRYQENHHQQINQTNQSQTHLTATSTAVLHSPTSVSGGGGGGGGNGGGVYNSTTTATSLTTTGTTVPATAGTVASLDGASFPSTTAPAFGAFNFPPVVMAHLMYNHGGGGGGGSSSQHSQQSNASGSESAGK